VELFDVVVGGLERGVVDENVESTELVDAALNQSTTVIFFLNVTRQTDASTPGAPDESFRFEQHITRAGFER
jgi:hypothetical protein